jgi:hypothetical protein
MIDSFPEADAHEPNESEQQSKFFARQKQKLDRNT